MKLLPDALLVHPVHLDYPLFRHMLTINRARFDKVIVVFTQMNTGRDYRPFLREQFNRNGIITLDSRLVEAKDDWRDVAVNTGLACSKASWIWFLEQDFIPADRLWEELAIAPKADVYFVDQGNRMHPCCLLVKRRVLNATSRDFSARPPLHDHFGQIEKDLKNWHPPLLTHQLNPVSYQHLNGLSQNLYLLQIGQPPNYEPERFKEYCQKCLQVTLPIQPEIRQLLEDYVRG